MADYQLISDDLVARFLAGKTDPGETERVRKWLTDPAAGSQEPNRDDFARIKKTASAAVSAQPAMDADAAWQSEPQRMRLSDRKPATRIGPRHTSFPAQPKGSRINNDQPIWQLATVLALVAGMGWLTFRLQYMGKDHLAARMVTLTANDQKISKTLPDGTRIVLSQHSTLRYPVAFSDERRDVALTGESFFDVSPDTDRTFRVEARKNSIHGQGTSFTVQAYGENVTVTVQTGDVQFCCPRKAIRLTKKQQATFDASANTFR
jgi:transmembrane sensor